MLKGSCLCGGIAYEIVGPVGKALYCHCSMCRNYMGLHFEPGWQFQKVRSGSFAARNCWLNIGHRLSQSGGFVGCAGHR